jgi:hypothetical protein
MLDDSDSDSEDCPIYEWPSEDDDEMFSQPRCCCCICGQAQFLNTPAPSLHELEGCLLGPLQSGHSEDHLYFHINCALSSASLNLGTRTSIPHEVLQDLEVLGYEGKRRCMLSYPSAFVAHYADQLRQVQRASCISQCSECEDMGATLCCAHPGCSMRFHLRCAWTEHMVVAVPAVTMDSSTRSTWISFCAEHSRLEHARSLPTPRPGNVCISVRDLDKQHSKVLADFRRDGEQPEDDVYERTVLLPVGTAAETDQQLTVVLADDSSVTVRKSDLLLPLDLPWLSDYREQTREARDEQLRATAAKTGAARHGAALSDADSGSGGSDNEDDSSAVASMQAQVAAADATAAAAGGRVSVQQPSRSAKASKKRRAAPRTTAAAAAAAELDDSSSDDTAGAAAGGAATTSGARGSNAGADGGGDMKPAKRTKKEHSSDDSATPAHLCGPSKYHIPKKVRAKAPKAPTAVPGRPGVWQVEDSDCSLARGFYYIDKSSAHVALSAKTVHMFKGPFNSAVLAEDHQKHRGDKEVQETHLVADVATMQHPSNTYTGGHAKHKRKPEAKAKRATSTTTGSVHTSAASGGALKHASSFEPFSGLNNMQSTSARDTAHGQQRGHMPQKATTATAAISHKGLYGAGSELRPADLVQHHSVGAPLAANQRVKEEPRWDQFDKLQSDDPRVLATGAAAAATAQWPPPSGSQSAGRSILKSGSSNNKREPDVFQHVAVPSPATVSLDAAAPFAPELQTAKLADVAAAAVPKVKREVVIVHTDDTTELARTELDLLDDSQDVLPAFCKLCGNDFKANLPLIAGRPFAHWSKRFEQAHAANELGVLKSVVLQALANSSVPTLLLGLVAAAKSDSSASR